MVSGEVKQQLWRSTYDFSRANAKLTEMGLPVGIALRTGCMSRCGTNTIACCLPSQIKFAQMKGKPQSKKEQKPAKQGEEEEEAAAPQVDVELPLKPREKKQARGVPTGSCAVALESGAHKSRPAGRLTSAASSSWPRSPRTATCPSGGSASYLGPTSLSARWPWLPTWSQATKESGPCPSGTQARTSLASRSDPIPFGDWRLLHAACVPAPLLLLLAAPLVLKTCSAAGMRGLPRCAGPVLPGAERHDRGGLC